MFDIQTRTCDAVITKIQALFATHGADLEESALLLRGASAETRVTNCLAYLQDADHLDHFVRRELRYFHSLFSLEFPTAFDDEELHVEPVLDPGSRAVEKICFLTDRLRELLELLGEPMPDPFEERSKKSLSFFDC